MSDEPVTLDFLARQNRRVLDEIASLREEMQVQSAIILRIDRDAGRREERDADMLNQMRAMVRQFQRFSERLRAVEEERR